jgi:carboxyl-terminal processing protease
MKYIPLIFLFALCIGNKTSEAQTSKELDRFNSIVHLTAEKARMSHFAYDHFDDAFSGKLFAGYLETLDKWHAVFLQKDIDGLKKYETKLDDELNGAPVRFSMEVERLYKTRLKEAQVIYTKLLSQPFNLDKKGQFLATAPATFPANREQQAERWRQWLTWEIETEMYSLLEERQQQGITLTAEALEQEAREAVKNKFTGFWYCLLNKMNHERYLGWYLNAFCKILDPHSDYLDAIGQDLYANYLGGTACSIGIETDMHHGLIRITRLEQGGAAQLSGKINPGDVIISTKEANGKPEVIAGYSKSFLKRIFEGAAGTTLTLYCKKPDGIRYEITLERTFIKVETRMVKSAIIETNGEKIGYVVIPAFYAGTDANVGKDMAKEVTKLNAEKVKAIVLDLRNNMGGNLEATVKVLSEFLPQGPAIQIKTRMQAARVVNTENKTMNFSGPVVLLVNQHTISCGDLFTSVFKDYNRGLIIGSPTAGKGTGSMVLKIEDTQQNWDDKNKKENFGQLSLTVIKYYGITGHSIHQKGVIPDVVLPEYRDEDYDKEAVQKHVLPCDSIAPVRYPVWNFGFDLESLKNKMQEEVSQDAAYKQIAGNEAWLKKADREPVSLHWSEYAAYRKEMSRRVNESQALGKINNRLSVRSINSQATEDQGAFLKRISADRYVYTAAAAALQILKTK